MALVGYKPKPSGYRVDMVFDVEATGGRAPSLNPDKDTGSLMMIGFCPVRYKIGEVPTAANIGEKRAFYIGDISIGEKETSEFWGEHREIYEMIRNAGVRKTRQETMDEIALYLMKFLLDGDQLRFWAYPIGYDWTWLQTYMVSYSKYYTRSKDFGIDLGYSPRCIRTLEDAARIVRGDIVDARLAALAAKPTHFADEDAYNEARVYVELLSILHA